MATSEHTPGPWERDGMQVKKGNRLIAYTEFVGDIPLDEDIANADLLTAAPLLLEAAKDAAEYLFRAGQVGAHSTWSKLCAAIAAASGEGER